MQLVEQLYGVALATRKALRKHINVTHIRSEQDITVQFGYNEDGQFVMDSCNHAGASLVEYDAPIWDADSGQFQPTGSDFITTCDKCDAMLIDGEWA